MPRASPKGSRLSAQKRSCGIVKSVSASGMRKLQRDRVPHNRRGRALLPNRSVFQIHVSTLPVVSCQQPSIPFSKRAIRNWKLRRKSVVASASGEIASRGRRRTVTRSCPRGHRPCPGAASWREPFYRPRGFMRHHFCRSLVLGSFLAFFDHAFGVLTHSPKFFLDFAAVLCFRN